MYCRGNPVKYSDPSGYDPIYSPVADYGSSRGWTHPDAIDDTSGNAALGLITSALPATAAVKLVLRARSYARFVKEGLELRNKIYNQRGDEEGATISWIQSTIRSIKNKERGDLTNKEIDHIVQVGRSKGLDFKPEGPHADYPNYHLHILNSNGERVSGHLNTPPNYPMP